MMNLNENEAKNLLADPIQFKLFYARKYLETIPTFVPLDIYPKERVIAEMTMECFLFFAGGALDVLFQEINKKFNLGIKQNQVRPSTIIQALKNNQTPKTKAILGQFQKYFQEPVHTEKVISDEDFNAGSARYGNDGVGFFTEYENRDGVKYQHFWNRSNSNLWMLRNQRNLITHESLLKRAALRGTVPAKDYLRIRLVYNDQPTQMWDSVHYENPKECFTEALNHLKSFVDAIKAI